MNVKTEIYHKILGNHSYNASFAIIYIAIDETAVTMPNHFQYSPLSNGRFPTNFPVWPFIANVYLFPFHMVLRSHTGKSAYLTMPLFNRMLLFSDVTAT